MGKARRWLRSILAGKSRGRDKALPLPHGDAVGTPVPKEKKRWSFRRAPAQGKPAAAALPSPLSQEDPTAGDGVVGQSVSGRGVDYEQQSEKAAEVAVAAADAAVMAAAQAVANLAEAEEQERDLLLARWLLEEAAAARIQATFRGYLARKALCALRGLVKLQALIRGQVVRRQANATLRRMQALVSAQSRLRAQQARMLDHHQDHHHHQRRSPQHPRRRSSYEMDRSGVEHVKTLETDAGDVARRGRSSCSAVAEDSRDRQRLAAEYYYQYGDYGQCSPAPSSFAELSPRTYSGHLDDLLPFDPAAAAGFVPSYMANTESSRAKARSQSAPRQRAHDAALERQPSRRRATGGGAPSRNKTMQRSSSHIITQSAAAAACGYLYQHYQYPPCAGVRLDRSSASLVGSECGSTSSVLTAATVGGYGRSLVGFEVHNRAHY